MVLQRMLFQITISRFTYSIVFTLFKPEVCIFGFLMTVVVGSLTLTVDEVKWEVYEGFMMMARFFSKVY